MFLKKLFNFSKDYSYYLEKGDKYLADEQYAHARNAYGEAREKFEAGGVTEPSVIEALNQKIAQTGNMLGRLNLVEAEHAIASGNRKKAAEDLHLILELADDAGLREKAERLLAGLAHEPAEAPQAKPAHGCSSCKGGIDEAEGDDLQEIDENITGEDRLALFYHALPEDLPVRYAGMGDEFNRGCLLKLEGQSEEALRAFEKLSAETENDILCYEQAILHYQKGDTGKCELLLIKAIGLNPVNPLCNIGLVQLYNETGREGEALLVVERMVSCNVMPGQATLMLGDQYAMLQEESKAIECYSGLLASPIFAKQAAERIVPILEGQGRTEEAAFLFKKYAKGCC